MPARDMVRFVKQVDWEGCAVPKYFRRERNQCRLLCLSPQAHQRRLSFFPLRGLDWRRVAGGDSRVLCHSPHLSQLKYQEKQAEASPRFPSAAGKWFPCVARGAASGGCCLGVAKAKSPWGWFALFACSKAPLLGVFFPVLARACVVLARQMVPFSICKMEICQCISATLVLGVIAVAAPRPEILQEPD